MRSAAKNSCALALCALLGAESAFAAPAKFERLTVEPATVALSAADERVQLLVTAHSADGALDDVTADSNYVCSNAAVARIAGGEVVPTGDGTAEIEIRLANPADGRELSIRVPVSVTRFNASRPLNFVNDIEPVLSKFSCNSGGCHGKASGQNGFKLSLLGFDAAMDYDALVKQGHGRRVFPAAPERSLLLTKPTGQAVHGGGKRFEVGSPAYRLLRSWIEQGLPQGKADDPRVVRISVTPAERIMRREANQQLRVVATLSDDTTKDVTAAAEYRGQQVDLVSVTPGGRISTLDATGEGTVMVRYMGLVEVARVSVPFGQQVPETEYAKFQPRNFIDTLVLAKWRKLGIAPSERSTDPEFLRRAFLDCIGTLPTPEEARAFMADSSPDKRVALVDRLLTRNEYASFWATKWGDLLRNKRRYGDQYKRGTFSFAAWIRNAFQQNMPYDQFVAAILTAQGTLTDNPPVVWYREVRNVVHQVNDTSQLFLGTRLNCANCHHHPYERWSQDDYWGLAAFYARLGSKPSDVPDESAVFVRKDGGVSQPRTGQAMKPKALGGPEFEYVRGEDPRQKLVDWMTAADNPFFAKAISNRTWAHFMGVGLVDAVDDMRVTNPPSNPELLDALARECVEHKFDLKQLIRTIMTSETYGLSSTPTEYNSKDRRNYARFVPKRLSSEVLSDALDALTGTPEKFPGLPIGTRAIELPDESVGSYLLDVFGRSQRDTPCECERSYAPNLAQVLHLMNSSDVQNKLASGEGRIAKSVSANRPPEEIVNELYLAAYARLPDPAELADSLEYVGAAKDPRAALSDLMWVMLNCKEFLFNH
jgi:hypothetical protein